MNLSRSGGAGDPHNVVDAWGRVHILWQDEFAGLVYSQGAPETLAQADGWSAPAPLSLPFEEALATLVMVADSQGLVHAAWLTEDGNLFYSRVPGQSFDNPGAWSSPLLMAVSAADFSMTAAPDGKVHLAFLRNTATSDFPAGIYSRFNYGSSDVWSLPNLVYVSPYLRGLDSTQAQLSLAASPDGSVYLAWDETPQEKIYLAVSKDGGNIWGDPVELDRRQPGDGGSSGPSKPVVLTTPGNVLLTWQAGHQGTNCAHYYRQSLDGGTTWSEPGLLPEPFAQSCAQRLQVVQKAGTETWLALTNPTGLYLLAYDPTRASEPWSPPRLQQDLSGFTHPETYRAVSLACRDVTMAGEQMIASACEVDKNGDIWFLQRLLGETATWFPTPAPPPFWSEPAVLAASPEIVNAPVVTGDPQGRLHTFWTQANDSSLYHALWDGETWSPASALFRSPGGEPGKLTAAVHPSGQLFLVWSDAAVGTLYYSQAPYGQAVTPAAWSAPLPLPLMLADTESARAAVDPQLEIGADGRLYLAYALPFNENRGIYVQRSLQGDLPGDPGQEIGWSQAETVLDAEAAGWDSLGEPRLAILPDGRLELLWTR